MQDKGRNVLRHMELQPACVDTRALPVVECCDFFSTARIARRGLSLDGSDREFTAPTLIVTGGDLDGQTIAIENGAETVLGSAADSFLPLRLGNVAPQHARLVWSEQVLLLSDLESATGTYVNGERVTTDHRLSDGDRVCLGPPGSKQSVKLLVSLPETFAQGAGLGLELESEPLTAGGLDLGLGEPLDLPSLEPTPLVLIDSHTGRPMTPVPMRGTAGGITATASDELSGTFAVEADPPAKNAAPAIVERLTSPAPEPKTETRKIKPEYTTDMPSIMSEPGADGAHAPSRPVARAPVATTPRRPTPARASGLRIGGIEVPPIALLAGGGVVALVVVGWGLSYLLRAAPTIIAMTPLRAETGTLISINGTGFASSAAGNEVLFAGQAGEVQSAEDQRLTVKVPNLDLSKGPLDAPVVVRVRGKSSKPELLHVFTLAHIRTIAPDIALPGTEIALTLSQLPDGEPKVFVAGLLAEIVEKRLPLLRVRVPALQVPLGAKVPVTVQGIGDPGPPAMLLIGKLPLLSELSPASGPAGARVTLKGRGFAADPGASSVTFAGRPALVLSASATELVVAAPPPPASETQFPAPVVVTVAGTPSNAQSFAQTRTSSSVFVLHFFAAPVEGDATRATVATELAPVFLLSDRDDASSVGERAARLSDALNALVDNAQSGRLPAFELRESPRPGVGIAGGASLLGATSADVAGYQAQAKGVQAAPRTLAAHWTAVLQDYFALFVAYRRPSAMAELSPRGKVLIDLFADAERHSQPGATGVPRSLVAPPPASLERDLRAAALVLAGGGADKAVAGIAIEGTWSGSMEEPGVESRNIRMTLGRQGGKLGGSVATESRGLAMAIPLQDLTYEKGVVKFVLVVGGSPRQFTGTLQGATLGGTIGVPGKPPVGSFSLTFVK
jgi:FHA domain/IPT/TIG domain